MLNPPVKTEVFPGVPLMNKTRGGIYAPGEIRNSMLFLPPMIKSLMDAIGGRR